MSCDIQPARHNHQPTHQQGTKWAGKAWPKMKKDAIFGSNLVFLGQQILIFNGEIKSFVTHITENPPRHLVCIVFWLGMGPKGPKCQYFGQKILIFIGVSKSFGTHIMEKTPTQLVRIVFWLGIRSNGQNADIWPKMPILGQIWLFLGPKSNFLGSGSTNFGTLVSGFQWDTFFVLKTLISGAPIGR